MVVTQAAQPNITSVGTLTGLYSSGNVTAPFFMGGGNALSNIQFMSAVSGAAQSVIQGAQPNITSVGTLSSLNVNTLNVTSIVTNNPATSQYVLSSTGTGLEWVPQTGGGNLANLVVSNTIMTTNAFISSTLSGGTYNTPQLLNVPYGISTDMINDSTTGIGPTFVSGFTSSASAFVNDYQILGISSVQNINNADWSVYGGTTAVFKPESKLSQPFMKFGIGSTNGIGTFSVRIDEDDIRYINPPMVFISPFQRGTSINPIKCIYPSYVTASFFQGGTDDTRGSIFFSWMTIGQ